MIFKILLKFLLSELTEDQPYPEKFYFIEIVPIDYGVLFMLFQFIMIMLYFNLYYSIQLQLQKDFLRKLYFTLKREMLSVFLG